MQITQLVQQVATVSCCITTLLCCVPPLQRLDSALASVQEGRSTAEHPVEAALAEVEDLLSYCNDIIGTGARLQPACNAQLEASHDLCKLLAKHMKRDEASVGSCTAVCPLDVTRRPAAGSHRAGGALEQICGPCAAVAAAVPPRGDAALGSRRQGQPAQQLGHLRSGSQSRSRTGRSRRPSGRQALSVVQHTAAFRSVFR